jgi:enhancer of polycomb-like protein
MRHAMSLLSDHDSVVLSTDPTLVFQAPDGHQQKALPFRLGIPPPIRGMPARPPPPGYVPPIATSTQQAAAAASLQSLGSTPTPISVSTPLKKMQSPVVHPSLRISSNGGMRPPVAPAPHVLSSQATAVAPMVNGANATHAVNGANGVNGVVNHTPTDAEAPMVNHPPSILNGTGPSPSHAETNNADANGSSPSRPKPEMPHHLMSSYLPSLNGFPNIANASPYPHLSNTLSPAQKAQLKTALVGVDVASGGRLPYMGHVVPNGAAYNMQQAVPSGMNMKFAGARPMQWPGSPSQQRPIPGTGLDSRGLGGSVSPSPIGQAVPVRTPSANGLRPGMRPGGVGHVIGPNGQLAPHAMSPHLRHSPLQLPQNMPQVPTHPSPPRPPQTPMLMASPSLPHHQSVGTQGGY